MKSFLYLLIFFLSFGIQAQHQYKFSHFTTDEGLPSNTIYSIAEDKKGNIILGTDNGLSIFDGNEFTNYNVQDGLINPYITAVSVDEKGVIWYINYNGKLQKFENNKITNTPVFTETFNQLINLKDKLFLYTIQNRYSNNCYGYYKINKNNWQTIKPKNTTNKNIIAPPILIQDNQEIRFENNNLNFNNLKLQLPDEVKLVHKVIFRKNDVCILDENFLFFVNFNGIITNKIKLPQPLSINPIYKYDFIVDNHENCWLNIQGKGLYILINNNWNAISENLELNTTENINFLYCDKNGKIWITTNENGLFCIPDTSITNIRFNNKENYFNGFANSLDAKSLFVSTKFSLYSYKNNKLNLLEKSNLEVKIDNYNKVPVFCTPLKDKINWNQNNKIFIISGKQIIKKEKDNYYVLAGNSSINLFENENGNFNFRSINSKVPKKEKIKQVVLYKNEYYFNNAEIINIRTFDNKFIYNKRDLKFKIKGFIEDFIFIKDTMWIATNNTIYKAFNETIIDSIKTINNIKLDNIHKIKNINNSIYICAGNGLFKILKNKNRVLNKYNFLPNNDTYNVALFENELLVATKDGLAIIDNNLIEKRTITPKVDIFYNGLITEKIYIKNAKVQTIINLKIQNFNHIKNQIIQYKIDKSAWINSLGLNIDFQSIDFGTHKITIRIKDVNSSWVTKTIVITKQYPIYMQWSFILAMIFMISNIVYAIYQYQIKLLKNKNIKENNTKNKIVELRQNALSSMMNPHFIFNSLNAIQYFVNSNQKEQSSEYLAKLARLVRLFLSQAAEPMISLDSEINRLKIYLELEQVRFGNFEFVLNIDNNINLQNLQIPNMIVQPFIENAILHGVSNLKKNDGKIELNFNLTQNILSIEIIDNGFGVDSTKQKNDSHVSKGVAIVTERINILQELYPDKIFSVNQDNVFANTVRKGYKIVIKVTIINSNEMI